MFHFIEKSWLFELPELVVPVRVVKSGFGLFYILIDILRENV